MITRNVTRIPSWLAIAVLPCDLGLGPGHREARLVEALLEIVRHTLLRLIGVDVGLHQHARDTAGRRRPPSPAHGRSKKMIGPRICPEATPTIFQSSSLPRILRRTRVADAEVGLVLETSALTTIPCSSSGSSQRPAEMVGFTKRDVRREPDGQDPLVLAAVGPLERRAGVEPRLDLGHAEHLLGLTLEVCTRLRLAEEHLRVVDPERADVIDRLERRRAHRQHAHDHRRGEHQRQSASARAGPCAGTCCEARARPVSAALG